MIFIFIVLLCAAIIFLLYCKNSKRKEPFTQCEHPHLILNKKDLAHTKELLLEFIRFAKSENIDFFAIGGTLVGSVRNGGLLSFDDDIDLGVLKNDVEKIKNYKSDVYFFEEARYGYLFRFKKPNKLFVDIMVFEQVNDQYKIINNNWENESLFINELKPLVPMIFSDVPIFVPNKYLQYMDRVFPNWQNEIRMDCGHHTDGKCLYETLKVPKTFSTDYEDSKYMCYSLLE
jgi:phosphorylcholine metabolism protein LicD